MSEIAGLDYGIAAKIRNVNVTSLDKITFRERVIKRPIREIESIIRTDQTSLEDYRYNPLTRGEGVISNYKIVTKPTRQTCLKKNPRRAATSFIPKTAILADQPAIQNPASPDYYALRANPMTETPDETVCNSLTEARNMTNMNLMQMNMLNSRQDWVNVQKQAFRRDNPNAPEIVDIKLHEHSLKDLNIFHPKIRGTKFSDRKTGRKAGKVMGDIAMKTNRVHDINKHRQDIATIAKYLNSQDPGKLLEGIDFKQSPPPYQTP